MDRYESRIGKIASLIFNRGKPYAITLGQTTYFSCYAYQVKSAWHKHEDCHKQQWQKEGKIKFLGRYIWQWLAKGYDSIDYEIEARKAELK